MYPSVCISCLSVLELGTSEKLCPICRTKWESEKLSLRNKFKGVPSVMMGINSTDGKSCVSVSSLLEYHSDSFDDGYEVQRRIIYELKRRTYTDLTDFITEEMYEMISEVLNGYRQGEETVITSIPRNRRNLRRSGIDNMRIVGENLAKMFGFKYVSALRQKPGVKEQKHLKPKQREANMTDSLYIDSKYMNEFKNRRVLLLDDVVTTGSSIKAAAGKLIKDGGAKHVLVFSITMNSQCLLRNN